MRGFVVALAALGVACTPNDRVTVCPLDLIKGVAPVDTTIPPGGQITPRVTLLGCAGTQVLADSLTWASTNPTVAAVATHSGVVVGVQPGMTIVAATGKTYGNIGSIRVTVR
jgi:hypothetical protein